MKKDAVPFQGRFRGVDEVDGRSGLGNGMEIDVCDIQQRQAW